MSKRVVLTGVTGFIAKRIAFDLLEAGHSVRGSLRSAGREGEVRDALRPRLSDPSALDRLSFVELDLARDDGWAQAMDGADALFHTASPFPLSQPKDENDIIRPAVDGKTLRAMRAAQATGVSRVVLTSSVVAIEAKDKSGAYTEDDWSDPGHPKSNAYYKSKTMAERAAWDFVADNPEMQLTTINPALVPRRTDGRPLRNLAGTGRAHPRRQRTRCCRMSVSAWWTWRISRRCISRRCTAPESVGQRFHRLERHDDHAADGATPRRTSSRPQDRDPDRAQAGAAAPVAVRPVDPWHSGRRRQGAAVRQQPRARHARHPVHRAASPRWEKAADAVLAKGVRKRAMRAFLALSPPRNHPRGPGRSARISSPVGRPGARRQPAPHDRFFWAR